MPRKTNKNSTDEEDKSKVNECIVAVLERKHSSLALSPLHACVNRLVNNSRIPELQKILHDNISKHFLDWSIELGTYTEKRLLTNFSNKCIYFKSYCEVIPKIYNQYDEHMPDPKKKAAKIIESIFADIILDKANITESINNAILEEIKIIRGKDGEQNFKVIHTIVNLFYRFNKSGGKQDKNSHFNVLVSKIKDSTSTFYEEFFKSHYPGESFSKFLRQAKERLTLEEQFLAYVFKEEDINRSNNNNKLERSISDNALEILEDAIKKLFFDNNSIFSKPKGLDPPPFCSALINKDVDLLKWMISDCYLKFNKEINVYIVACAEHTCFEILNFITFFEDENVKPAELTNNIKNIMDVVCERRTPFMQVFTNNESATAKFASEVAKGWNNPKFNIVQNFVNYIDINIRNEFKNLSPEERARFPARCAQFFSYTVDKLPFTKTYEMSFIQRLIKMGNKLRDIEFPIIEKIRSEKCAEFMSHFNHLNDDIRKSEVDSSEFKQEMSSNQEKDPRQRNIDFSPLVLKKQYYTPNTIEEKVIPSFLQTIHESFNIYYQRKYPKSQLTLLIDVSTVESKWKLQTGDASKSHVYVIVADLVCSKILHAVATNKECSLAQINDIVQEERALVCKYIWKLCTATKILRRAKFIDKRLADSDIFEMNQSFVSKSKRIIIPSQINQRKENEKKNNANIELGKIDLIKASIVRSLKQKNRVPQSEVEADTISAVRHYFQPDLSLIRQQLFNLEKKADDEGYFHREGIGENEVLVYHQ